MDTPIVIKKKKAHAHAHHGGSWKVAYADFVTAMMAFFMVMWIMGLSDDTRAQIQGYFNDPIGFVKNQPRSKNIIAVKGVPTGKPGQRVQRGDDAYMDERNKMQKLKSDFEKALGSDKELAKLLQHMDIQITEDGLRIEFIEDKQDFFESGSDVLKPGAQHLISLLGPKIAASGRPMIIEGHTDTVPFTGDPMGNFGLSTKRAWALAAALGHSGVAEEKLRSVSGLGDRELRDPNHPTSAANRRVTILLPFVTPKTATQRLPKDELSGKMSSQTVHIDFRPQTPDLVKG